MNWKLKVYPLTFAEYLEATGEGALLAEIKQGNWATLATFHDRLAELKELVNNLGAG